MPKVKSLSQKRNFLLFIDSMQTSEFSFLLEDHNEFYSMESSLSKSLVVLLQLSNDLAFHILSYCVNVIKEFLRKCITFLNLDLS